LGNITIVNSHQSFKIVSAFQQKRYFVELWKNCRGNRY